MGVRQIHRPNAFFQREQRRIDLRALATRLPLIIFRVRRAFAAGQIDENQPERVRFLLLIFARQLENGVRTRRVGVERAFPVMTPR